MKINNLSTSRSNIYHVISHLLFLLDLAHLISFSLKKILFTLRAEVNNKSLKSCKVIVYTKYNYDLFVYLNKLTTILLHNKHRLMCFSPRICRNIELLFITSLAQYLLQLGIIVIHIHDLFIFPD